MKIQRPEMKIYVRTQGAILGRTQEISPATISRQSEAKKPVVTLSPPIKLPREQIPRVYRQPEHPTGTNRKRPGLQGFSSSAEYPLVIYRAV